MKNKIVTQTAQQGDVLLRKISKLPKGERKIVSKGKMVLAEGEVTGHYHGVIEENSCLFEVNGSLFLQLEEPATVTHQEHGEITLDKGIWQVGIVKEYDYFAGMVRKVVD